MAGLTIPRIPGTGHFVVRVAGTSDYRASFDELCGARRMQSVHIKTPAHLVVRDNTVAVLIKGLQVGALSTRDARAFDRIVRYGVLSTHQTFECAALISGGWSSESGIKDYSIRLDLNLGD